MVSVPLRQISKVELAGFADGLDAGCKKRRVSVVPTFLPELLWQGRQGEVSHPH